jgi:hypothetical protein
MLAICASRIRFVAIPELELIQWHVKWQNWFEFEKVQDSLSSEAGFDDNIN